MTPPPTPAAAAGGPWTRFRQRHLFDYAPPARRFWLALVLAGTAALAWALQALAAEPPARLALAAGHLALVALAAVFVVRIPRSSYSVSVADLFIFSTLLSCGPAAATLASAVEGTIATWRTSRRLSSRLASPAAMAAAMAVCAAVYARLQPALASAGLTPAGAALAAVCAVALLPYLLSTTSLLAMFSLKQGRRPSLRDLLGDSSAMAAMFLGSAFVAGLLHLEAVSAGPWVLAVAAAVMLALSALLRVTLQRLDAERQTAEDQVSRARHEAELNHRRFLAAFTHAAVGMAVAGPDGRVRQVNPALCALLGHAEADLLGQAFADLLPPAAPLPAGPDADPAQTLRFRAADGVERWVLLRRSQYPDPGDGGLCTLYQLHDHTLRHQAEARLQHIAFHDTLTDLANRHAFHDCLQTAVDRARRDPGWHFGMLYLDLDRFKVVNDSLGHSAGNRLLREIARRLRAAVRPHDLVARLGGDEFAILLAGLAGDDEGLHLAERVLGELGRPLALQGAELLPAASLGLTCSTLGERAVDEILRDADLAMYAAKAAGRGRIAVFDRSMHARVAEKLALETELRQALAQGGLSLVFQPMFELASERPYGFEALARWQHPQRGAISPATFIALAEETGHIEALSDWVIDQAVAQMAAWRRTLPAAAALGVHVNISSRDLGRRDLAQRVEAVLLRHGLPAACLTLEITETTLMGRLDVALQTMGRLQQLGVRFSIDDFGTGYSSLAYLGTLPIDSLKIDRSFVMGLDDKPHNAEIVRAVLDLGRSLGRRVIAEGIETAEQLATLRRLGVPIGQGYHLSRPLPAAQVAALLGGPPTAVAAAA